MRDMYKGAINSPETTTTNNISNSDVIIYVLDETKVPTELPNLMVLGTGTGAETVKVISIDGQAITVERAFQGIAKAWNAGTIIARNFTEYDYEALRINIGSLANNQGDLEAAIADNSSAIGQNTSDLNAHKAESVSKTVLITEPFNQATTTTINLGFRPKSIMIDAVIMNTNYESMGYSDGVNSHSRFRRVSDNTLSISGDVVRFQNDSTNNQIVGVASFTDTGITIAWSVIGTLTISSGNRRFAVLANTHGEG